MHKLWINISLLIALPAVSITGCKSKKQLTVDFLTQSSWSSEYTVGSTIRFKNEKGKPEYIAEINSVMSDHLKKGTYTLEKGLLNLYETDGKTPYLKKGTLVYDEKAVKYYYSLKFEDGTVIYNKDRQVPAGKEVVIDGQPAVTMGIMKATLSANMKFRKKPDLSAKLISCVRFGASGEPGDTEEVGYIPSNRKVIVLARTKQKFKVQKWKNYWYYVEAPVDELEVIYKKGWMFSEFVKIQK